MRLVYALWVLVVVFAPELMAFTFPSLAEILWPEPFPQYYYVPRHDA